MKSSDTSRDKKAGVFIIESGDSFLRDEVLRKIMAHYAGRDKRDAEVNILSAVEAEPADVFDELRSAPLFSSRKIVVLKDLGKEAPKDAEKDEKRRRKTFVERNKELLLQYLDNPSRVNLLVIMLKKLTDKKIAEKVRKVGRVITSRALYENQVPGWIMARSRKKYGKKMPIEAAILLFEKSGADMAKVDSELEKLSIYVGTRDTITEKDVELAATEDRQFNQFALPDAIAKRDASAAQRILERLLADGQKAPQIIYSISRQLKRIWKARRMFEKGAPFSEIFDAFKVGRHPKHRETFKRLVRHFSEEELRAKYELLQITDIQTKTGRLPDKLALEMLVTKLCEK